MSDRKQHTNSQHEPSPRVGWRDVGQCWVIAIVLTTLLLISL